MVRLTVVLFVAVTYCALSTSELILEDYSWRDFEGIVPRDAFLVGLNKNGAKTYIGQLLFEGKLIPGQIYENDENIYFEWAFIERKSKENVKILCAQNPEKLKWIPTNKDKVSDLLDKQLIKGGFEPNYFTYLGREITNHAIAGKVMCGEQTCLGLYTTEDGVSKLSTDFEILSIVPSKDTSLIDYYWRDYDGVIPYDALPGGLDKQGNTMYIGQALFENKLVPGKIYKNDPKVYFEMFGAEISNTTNNKILCTQTRNNFEWYSTNTTEINKLTNKIIVKGGFEPSAYSYVGRVFTGGETIVGKVICLLTDCLGLYIAKDGAGLLFNKSFEILTYKHL